MKLLRKPRHLGAPETHRLELLHRLAVSGTLRALREDGIEPDRWNRPGGDIPIEGG